MFGGPRLYRFYNYEQLHYFPAPVGGWNPDAAPWEIPSDQAHVLDNFLLRPGKLTMRAGMRQGGDLSAIASPYMPCGYVIGAPTWMTVQGKIPSSTATVDPWFAVAASATSAQLAVPRANAAYASSFDASQHSLPVTADQSLGPRWINFDGTLYGLSYGASTAPTTLSDSGSNYTTWATNLLTLSLTDISAGGHAPTVASGPPRGAWDLKGYQSRIWLLAGADTPGASTAHNAAALYFTNPISGGGGVTAADWKDPVSGVTNKIVMDRNISDYGVGLGVVRNGMVIFRRASIYLLRGSTTANYALTPVSHEVGCIDARSIVETDDGVYWLSDRGLMRTNGSTIVNLSGTITETLKQAIGGMLFKAFNAFAGGGTPWTSYYATAVEGSQGHIVISLGLQAQNGHFTPLFSAVYDPKTSTWTRINSQLWSSTTGDMVTAPYTLGSTPVLQNNMYPGMLISRQTPKRISALGDKYVTIIEDVASGLSIFQPDSQVVANALMDSNVAGATVVYPIPAAWQTGFVPVISASKRRLGIMKRYFCDYLMSIQPASVNHAWTVQPLDVTDSPIGTYIQPGVTDTGLRQLGPITGISGVPSHYISRHNQDFENEVDDVTFLTYWDGGGGSLVAPLFALADVYGLGVEFQQTRDAR